MRILFTYGTLLCPEIVTGLTGKTIASKDAVLPHFQRFAIYDNEVRRRYPAIAPQQDAQVSGTLLYVDEQSKAILDFYEGDEYVVQKVGVVVDGEVVEAKAYVWPTKNRHMLQGEWDLETFRKQDLSTYLDEIVPRYRARFPNEKRT